MVSQITNSPAHDLQGQETGEAEARIRLLTRLVQDATVITLDRRGRVDHWNASAERLLGHKAAEVFGKHISVLYSADSIGRGQPGEDLKRARQEQEIRGERQWVRRDKGTVPLEMIMAVRSGAPGLAPGLIVALRRLPGDSEDRAVGSDAPGSKASASEGRNEETSRTIDHAERFLSLLSHELRTPLTTILTCTSMLRARLQDEWQVRAVDMIERNTRVEAKLIDEISTLARVERERLAPALGRIDLAEVIACAVEDARSAAQDKGVSLKVEITDRVRLSSGHREHLERAVRLLLDNAIKSTEAPATVTIALDRTGSDARIVVCDGGPRFGGEMDGHQFVPAEAFEEEAATLPRDRGLGLGLYMARRLVELHGGSMSAQSAGTEWEGKTTVLLPGAPLGAFAPLSS